MAAFFIDLDGTMVRFGTNELLPGAIEMLREIESRGHQIIFTTRRGNEYPDNHVFGVPETMKLIESLGVKYQAMLFNIDSPRIVLNDGGGLGITHPKNEPLTYEIGDDSNPIELVRKNDGQEQDGCMEAS